MWQCLLLPFSLSLQQLTSFLPQITRQLNTDCDLRAYRERNKLFIDTFEYMRSGSEPTTFLQYYQPDAQYLKFILFWNNTLHVSGGLSVHHQKSKTVHIASGICHTGSVAACQQAATEPVWYATVCTGLDSWWWTERPSETCRVLPWLISNLMHKILIYLYIIHLLKSSTCFEHYPAHFQEVYVVTVYTRPLVSSLSAGDCPVHRLRKSSFLTGAQDSHLQRVTIPEAACIQLRRRPPENEQGNARNMQRILINVLYINK